MSTSATEVKETKAVRPEQVALAVQHAIGKVADELVRRAEEEVADFSGTKGTAKSPLRNVLAVATAPGSSKKVVQNFILYQAGRAQSGSEFWGLRGKKHGTVAEALVAQIDELDKLVDQVAEEACRLLKDTYALTQDEKRSLQMRLIQLFIGYLVRIQVAKGAKG